MVPTNSDIRRRRRKNLDYLRKRNLIIRSKREDKKGVRQKDSKRDVERELHINSLRVLFYGNVGWYDYIKEGLGLKGKISYSHFEQQPTDEYSLDVIVIDCTKDEKGFMAQDYVDLLSCDEKLRPKLCFSHPDGIDISDLACESAVAIPYSRLDQLRNYFIEMSRRNYHKRKAQ
ncbi:MAG: hypothetical protein U9O94_00030 [Nanoarchaeota archaeon]|nr:hypothetical protein [Nanoarchaeota archaeon]